MNNKALLPQLTENQLNKLAQQYLEIKSSVYALQNKNLYIELQTIAKKIAQLNKGEIKHINYLDIKNALTKHELKVWQVATSKHSKLCKLQLEFCENYAEQSDKRIELFDLQKSEQVNKNKVSKKIKLAERSKHNNDINKALSSIYSKKTRLNILLNIIRPIAKTSKLEAVEKNNAEINKLYKIISKIKDSHNLNEYMQRNKFNKFKTALEHSTAIRLQKDAHGSYLGFVKRIDNVISTVKREEAWIGQMQKNSLELRTMIETSREC